MTLKRSWSLILTYVKILLTRRKWEEAFEYANTETKNKSVTTCLPMRTTNLYQFQKVNIISLFISTFVAKHETKIKAINNIKSAMLSQQDLEGRNHSR